MMSPPRLSVLLALSAAMLGLTSPAGAREAYVANSAGGTISVFETTTHAPLATIPVGNEPSDVAIVPTGNRAYVTNFGSSTVSAIDTATHQVVGPPIEVGAGPRGIAISPDGTRAYVANSESDSVSVIATAANVVTATIPLAADSEPEGIAVTPDGAAAFVAQRSGDVALINTATNSVGGTVKTAAGLGPFRLSLIPDGSRAFLSNANSSSISILNTITATVNGSPILVGPGPTGVAVNPNGSRTYVASQGAGTVVAVDTQTHIAVGTPVAGFGAPAQIAVAPGGARVYVTDEAGSAVTVLDTLANLPAGKVEVGGAPQGIAIVPDQGPNASFGVSPTERKAGQSLVFDAGRSSDPDGSVALYAWEFGDGEEEVTSSPTIEHVYAKPGLYTATLTVTDNESCSSALLFTGQTVTCNGAPAARTSIGLEAIDATPPDFRLSGRRRQPLRRQVIVVGRCPEERCRASASGLLRTVQTTPSRKIRGKYRTRPAKTLLANGVERKLRLKLSGAAYRAARRALASDGSATVRVSAVGSDTAGNKQRRVLKIRLFEPRRGRGGGR